MNFTNKKTWTVSQYKIETDQYEAQGKTYFHAIVYNTNAKSYNAIKANYRFSTEEHRNKWVMDFTNNIKQHEQRVAERREERKARPKNTELTSIVKKALSDKWGFKNVKVNRGRGTAYGWVEASVSVPKPKNCTGDNPFYCNTCREKMREVSEKATEVSYQAVNQANLSFGHYYADDGYNTKRSEFLLDVKFK